MHFLVYILNSADRSHEIDRRQRESYEHHTINCTAMRAQNHDPLDQAKQKWPDLRLMAATIAGVNVFYATLYAFRLKNRTNVLLRR